jgi:uncharacterized membrane protein YbhN (UPF0104 family)
VRRRLHHRVSAKTRRRLLAVLRAVLGLAVLGYVITLVQPDKFETLGRPRHLAWAGFALVCLAANCWVAAWRWQLLLKGLGVRERIAPLLRAVYVGAFYNLVLPGQLGGQAIKVMLLGRRSPALAAILASVAMDQVVVIVSLFGLAFCSAATAPGISHRGSWMLGFGLTLLVAILLMLFLIAPRLQARLFGRARRGGPRLRWLPEALRRNTASSWRALSSYGEVPGLLGLAVFQGIVFLFTLAAMALGLARAVGIELDFRVILFVLMLALVAGAAPFTLAGLGTREAAFTAAFAEFGIARGTGAAFAILWLLLNSLADMVGGIMQFWHPRQTGTLERPVPRHGTTITSDPAD